MYDPKAVQTLAKYINARACLKRLEMNEVLERPDIPGPILARHFGVMALYPDILNQDHKDANLSKDH